MRHWTTRNLRDNRKTKWKRAGCTVAHDTTYYKIGPIHCHIHTMIVWPPFQVLLMVRIVDCVIEFFINLRQTGIGKREKLISMQRQLPISCSLKLTWDLVIRSTFCEWKTVDFWRIAIASPPILGTWQTLMSYLPCKLDCIYWSLIMLVHTFRDPFAPRLSFSARDLAFSSAATTQVKIWKHLVRESRSMTFCRSHWMWNESFVYIELIIVGMMTVCRCRLNKWFDKKFKYI